MRRRPDRSTLGFAFVALAIAACRPARPAADDRGEYRGEDRHPVDHFSTVAAFRAVFYERAAASVEAAWPTPGTAVGIAEASCTVRHVKTGRVAQCVPGRTTTGPFAAILRSSDTEPGAAVKARIAQCYGGASATWSKQDLSKYEAALVANSDAVPPAVGDAFAIAYVLEDSASFAAKCTPEPDGTCLYVESAEGDQHDQPQIETRVSRRGVRSSTAPFTPMPFKLELTFFDGHEPPVLRSAGLRAGSGGDDHLQDPSKIAWGPAVDYYREHEPTSPNYPVVLALAGRLDEAQAANGSLFGGTPSAELVGTDPCAGGKR